MLQLPPELVLLIQAAVAYLVFNGLKGLAEYFGIDLGQWGSVLVAAIAGAFVFFINSLLGAIPPGQTQQIIAAILQLLVLLVGGIAGSTRVRDSRVFVRAHDARNGEPSAKETRAKSK